MATAFSPLLFLPETPPSVRSWDFFTSPELPLSDFLGTEQDKAEEYFDVEAELLGLGGEVPLKDPLKEATFNVVNNTFATKKVPSLDFSGERSAKRKKTRKFRVRKACDSCHFRKTKCDNQRPCGPCTSFGKVCTEGSSEDRKRSARSNIKKLADKLNRHQGQPCNRQAGCLRPFRHPGHCRKGPPRKRKRKSKFVAAIEAAEEKARKLLTKRLDDQDDGIAMLLFKEETAEGSDVPEIDIQELTESQLSQDSWLEGQLSQDSWLTESQSSQETW